MLSINFGKTTEDNCDIFCDGYTNLSGKKIKGIVDWVFERKENILTEQIISLTQNSLLEVKLREIKRNLTKKKIRYIISCPYTNFDSINDKYKKFDFNFWITSEEKINLLERIFDYALFRKYKKTIINGFWLSKKLEIDCCPYCNRNYTTSHQTFFKNIKGKNLEKYVFPEFDHFYPKDTYAALAISFYNLIPSCNICNTHFKQNRPSNEIFSPYKKVAKKTFSFVNFPNDVATLYGAGNNIVLDFKYFCNKETENELTKSLEFFGIKDTYEKCHSDLIREIIHKKLAFSDRYISELQNTYKIPFEEAYKILFETYYEDDNHHKRPYSKIKKDIYEDLQ